MLLFNDAGMPGSCQPRLVQELRGISAPTSALRIRALDISISSQARADSTLKVSHRMGSQDHSSVKQVEQEDKGSSRYSHMEVRGGRALCQRAGNAARQV